MRVFCGYTPSGFRAETQLSLAQFAPRTTMVVDVSGDNFNYWNALKEHWIGDEDLVIVEQDMVLRGDILPSFAACDQDWCVYEYDAIGYKPFTHIRKVNCALGCVKFSATLQRRFPIQEFAVRVDWRAVDVIVASRLQFHGYDPHVHGEIEHLHNYTPEDLEYEMVGADKYLEFVEVSSPGGDNESDVRIRRAGPSE